MADWVGVFFGGRGGKGVHSRKYGNWPLYDNDMATGIRKNVNGYGGMQEPVKLRRNIRVILLLAVNPFKMLSKGAIKSVRIRVG